MSASRFMLEAGVRAAEDAVARQNRFVVPRAQWDEFVAVLDGLSVAHDVADEGVDSCYHCVP